jgi:asparagine synthase (glutamine-hydrolysing)
MLDLLPKFLAEFDEPFYDYSAIPVMAVSRLASEDVKVVLSGDGGDEAFGGYHYYRAAAIMARVYQLPVAGRRMASAVMRRLGGRLRLMGLALERQSPIAAFTFARSIIKENTSIVQPSLQDETQSLRELYENRAKDFADGLSVAEVAMRLDIGFTLPDDYLQKIDIGTMAYSVEAREPLLDHSILEWAARLATGWKVRGRENKYLLRRLAYRHVPRELVDRPKQGFGLPMAAWLRGELSGWAREVLDDSQTMKALELNERAINELWEAHQNRRVNASSTLWGVIMLLTFYRTHMSPRPAS